jgi:hypothetical protein
LSLALVLGTRSRIVLASDSRAWDREKGNDGRGRSAGDRYCKIAVGSGWPLNGRNDYRLGFAMTGYAAEEVFHCWQDTRRREATEAAKTRAQRVLSELERLHEPLDDAKKLTFGVVRYAGAQADTSFYQLQLGSHVEVRQRASADSLPYVVALGWDENDDRRTPALTAMQRRLAADPDEPTMVAMAREFIALAAKHTPKVGGRVHIATIDERGSRWIAI